MAELKGGHQSKLKEKGMKIPHKKIKNMLDKEKSRKALFLVLNTLPW